MPKPAAAPKPVPRKPAAEEPPRETPAASAVPEDVRASRAAEREAVRKAAEVRQPYRLKEGIQAVVRDGLVLEGDGVVHLTAAEAARHADYVVPVKDTPRQED